MSELTPEEQKAIEDLPEAVAYKLARGENKGKIVKELMKQGWPKESAVRFVDRVEQDLKQYVEQYKNSPEGRRVMASKYKRRMLYGALWAVGGTLVTTITYSAASGGGVYIIAWGAILFGIIDFFVGLFGWLKYKDGELAISPFSVIKNDRAVYAGLRRACSVAVTSRLISVVEYVQNGKIHIG